MFIHDNKYGFTLIETLVALACMPLLLMVVSAILKVMISHQNEGILQIEVLELQLRQTLARSSNISLMSESITYSFNNQNFSILRDGNRLIRTPGYEILITNLTKFELLESTVIICDENACIEI